MPDLFGKSRIAAFDLWQTGTNRTGCDVDECYDNSFECRWQSHANTKFGYNHISLFCSLADWSCNITDLLSDSRYDKHDFDDECHGEVLCRYYTRLMMVIAEHLADLEKIATLLGAPKGKAAREKISAATDKDWVDNFHKFVNCVCKHKAGGKNIHYCNHHLPICFDDMANPCTVQNAIRLPTVELVNGTAIWYPKLTHIVDGLLTAYTIVDEILMSDDAKFREICDRYEDINFEAP